MWFLAVWFLGDVTNLIGALWAGLVPTVIALAIYFCIADTALIIQCLYYKNSSVNRIDLEESFQPQSDDAIEPLLGHRVSEIGASDPGTRQLSASHPQLNGNAGPAKDPIGPEHQLGAPICVKNAGAVLAVCALGVTGWVIAWKTGIWRPMIDGNEKSNLGKDSIGASILGYISAVCYLG